MPQLFRISLQCIHMEGYNVFHNRYIRVLLAFFLGLSIMVWATPVQAAGAKSIVVSLSQQKLYAYQGKTLVYSAAITARGTRTGNFRVQNKLAVASALSQGWYLPYWMGIYYVGRIQNGIHGPEYLTNGSRAAISLGCVVIRSGTDAAWVYQWASVGTLVSIRR
jgi:lipoprotein-anchoring transpeptidase ErfK/SrfK